ncbi:MAG: sigma-70 family RNA polymerase sigma factor [Gemmataceae bacterium]|nr:sigma-70 family RNA polymerase sigma factor [Gemmataceae bacterium]
MSSGPIHRVLRHLRHAAQPANGGERPDAELLCSFLEGRDETAFAALVRRHSAMVLGVCRRVTGDAHDAEDAFQAAFCVLLRKARSIRRREVLGSWLYGVAYRTALAAKARRARTRRREQQVDAMPQPMHMPPDPSQDWQPLLDAAIERLPDKYRVPIILCDLEGKSRRDAARQLQVSEGTLSSRLARGRRLLAQRLKRHGLTLSGGALAAILAQNVASAQAPVSLVQAVSQAGAQVIVGQAPTFLAFSAPVVALTEGVMKAMLISKLKTIALVCVVCAAATLGGSWMVGAAADPPLAADAAQQEPGAVPQRAQPAQAAQPATIAQPAPAAQPPRAGQSQYGEQRLGGRQAAPRSALGHNSAAPPPSGASYRLETVIALPDSKEKTFTIAPVLTQLGRRTPGEVRTAVGAAGGQARPTQVMWNVEIVRQRGSDVLVNVIFDKKDRQSSAVVRGQSLEFEDFVPLGAWKTLTDASFPGVEFKIMVSLNLGVAADIPAGNTPPGADPLGPKTSPNRAPGAQPNLPAAGAGSVTSAVRLQYVLAAAILSDLKQKLGGSEVALGIDERTNSIVIRGPGAQVDAARAVIARLDVTNPAALPMPAADPPADRALPAAIAISPDGRRLAFASDQRVLLIDVQTGKLLSESVGDGNAKALAFSPDGKMLVAGTQQGAVNVYDVPTGKMIRKLLSKQPIVQIQMSPDGRTIITIGGDQTRIYWDMATGELKRMEAPDRAK